MNRAPISVAARSCAFTCHQPPRLTQGGASLVVSLVMLVAILLLGISATQIALQGEKASRNDRDRQVALQAAEAALMDAELDIEGFSDQGKSRSEIFAPDNQLPFAEPGCQGGVGNMLLGLCSLAEEGLPPAWRTIDFMDATDGAKSVPYGHFTGQSFQIGAGVLPARLPRYIIEQMLYNKGGQAADRPTYFYRVTAIGFGMRDTTQVVLQTFYRKDGH